MKIYATYLLLKLTAFCIHVQIISEIVQKLAAAIKENKYTIWRLIDETLNV